jgi:hypothetical protein
MADNFNVLDHGAIAELLVDAKGDLLTATADNTPARLAVGTDGHVLKAASGQTTGLQWAAATDTSTVPTADGATGSAGSSLTAAARDHVHPRTVWTAADYSYLAMSFDPVIAVTASTPSAAGTVQLIRIHLPATATVTNIVMFVNVNGTGLTSGQNFAALYSARLLGPDANGRLVYTITGRALRTAAGLTATVYSAATGSTLADIATYDGTTTPGASISGSLLTVDGDSLLPLFWFPNGIDTVYVSVNGGTRVAVNADYDARLDTVSSTLARRAAATVSGFPVTDNCFAVSGTTGTARVSVGTSRVPHTVAVACTDLRLVYGNWFNNGAAASPNYNDTDGTAVVQIKASVEISSVIYRVTFGGSVTGTMDGGGMLVSDPLPLDLTAGTVIYTRTFLASGTTGWYNNKYSYVAGGSGGFTTTTDLTAPGASAVADASFSPQFAPMAILGSSLTGAALPSVAIIGDSIAHVLRRRARHRRIPGPQHHHPGVRRWRVHRPRPVRPVRLPPGRHSRRQRRRVQCQRWAFSPHDTGVPGVDRHHRVRA